MPLEIRELIIRAEVKGGKSDELQDVQTDLDRVGLVSECVDKVLEILSDQKER